MSKFTACNKPHFGQIREIKFFSTPRNFDSRKLIPAKFDEFMIRENQFLRNGSRINELQILEFPSDAMSLELSSQNHRIFSRLFK